MSIFRRRQPTPDLVVRSPDPERTKNDVMVLVSSVVYRHPLEGPGGEVLDETFHDLPHLGAVLGSTIGVLAYMAAVHPDGPDAGLADLRRILDTALHTP